jgi:hypothetical protein
MYVNTHYTQTLYALSANWLGRITDHLICASMDQLLPESVLFVYVTGIRDANTDVLWDVWVVVPDFGVWYADVHVFLQLNMHEYRIVFCNQRQHRERVFICWWYFSPCAVVWGYIVKFVSTHCWLRIFKLHMCSVRRDQCTLLSFMLLTACKTFFHVTCLEITRLFYNYITVMLARVYTCEAMLHVVQCILHGAESFLSCVLEKLTGL